MYNYITVKIYCLTYRQSPGYVQDRDCRFVLKLNLYVSRNWRPDSATAETEQRLIPGSPGQGLPVVSHWSVSAAADLVTPGTEQLGCCPVGPAAPREGTTGPTYHPSCSAPGFLESALISFSSS